MRRNPVRFPHDNRETNYSTSLVSEVSFRGGLRGRRPPSKEKEKRKKERKKKKEKEKRKKKEGNIYE